MGKQMINPQDKFNEQDFIHLIDLLLAKIKDTQDSSSARLHLGTLRKVDIHYQYLLNSTVRKNDTLIT